MAKILLIDQSEDNRIILSAFLKTKQHYVFEASSWAVGLETAYKYQPDLIISASLLPDIALVELLDLRRDIPLINNIPFLFLLERACTSVENLLGNTPYYIKPIRRQEFLQKVENLIVTNFPKQAQLEKDLHLAIEKKELLLHYQPKVNIKTRKVVGVEALLRWQHERFGLVSPSIFIPIAEKTDFIQELGEWIFKEAFAQLNHWQMNKNLFLQMAINVSTLQIAKKDFVKTIRNLLKPYSFDPKYLELEITESSLVEFIPETLSTFHELKKLGVKIALDDFGTGYSNFSHLSSCPFDILKVDQSFVRGKVGDQRNATILNAIFQLANSLNLKTVVEGIENEQELNFISAYPCDEVQGYYFGKPMGADSIEQLLLL